MTVWQQVITIGLCVAGTMLTRFLPFLIFKEDRKTPGFVQYIGKYLPSAVFGMLVVYCLKNVDVLEGNRGLPELIAILVTGALHVWKRQMLLSIAGGTVCYMLLVRFVFGEGEAPEFRRSVIIEPPPWLSQRESQGGCPVTWRVDTRSDSCFKGNRSKNLCFRNGSRGFLSCRLRPKINRSGFIRRYGVSL